MNGKISAFLACKHFLVIGASSNREKYGNKVRERSGGSCEVEVKKCEV